MAKPVIKGDSATVAGLDARDLAILRLLQQNARMTVKEIAEKVLLSPTPVHERIRRLEESGVIRQYTALVDYARIRKGLRVIVYVSLQQHNRMSGAAFIKAIQEMPEVISCYNISGAFDFMLQVVAEDMDDYYNFHVNKLGLVENLGQIQSTFVMGVLKETAILA
jgi:Lrp/AsnC family leucine-responsive transcriptional regulator